MYEAIYDCFQKYSDCRYHNTDRDSNFPISVPKCSTIKQVVENVSCTMSITEFFKKKSELLMECFIKACFPKTKNYYLLTGKELIEKSFKSTNKATIKNHIDIDDYLNVVFNNKSQSVV